MKASEIHEVIMRRLVEERKVDASALRNRAFAAYVRARDEIRMGGAPEAGEKEGLARQ